MGLLFERLVRLDDNGVPQPSLAVSWQHDSEKKRWQFELRPDVKFHDGSSLTPESIVASLESTERGWSVSAAGSGVMIQLDRPAPELLSDLAHAGRAIFRRDAGGALLGTGAFRIVQWQPGRRATLAAHEDHWAGRPFLDAIAVEMGRTSREQVIDFELGKADLVEISPGEVRRAQRAKLWSSAPTQLLAAVFERGRPAGEDRRLREAVALSIDRATIHSTLLQKQGEPAGSFLPQWLSGYAFLFPIARDSARSRQLVSALSATLQPLSLIYDGSDAIAQAVAERIAVNAREVGIRLQVSGQSMGAPPAKADLRLVRVRIPSVRPAQALAGVFASIPMAGLLRLPESVRVEDLYAAERALVEDFRVIPLLHLPELYGARPQVKSWNTPGILKNGDWRFEDVWLDVDK